MRHAKPPSDAQLLAGIRAMQDAEMHAAGATPDPAYVAREHDLFVDLCAIFGSVNAYASTEPCDVDADGHGGMLLRQCPTPWRPVESCKDMNSLADASYQEAL